VTDAVVVGSGAGSETGVIGSGVSEWMGGSADDDDESSDGDCDCVSNGVALLAM